MEGPPALCRAPPSTVRAQTVRGCTQGLLCKRRSGLRGLVRGCAGLARPRGRAGGRRGKQVFPAPRSYCVGLTARASPAVLFIYLSFRAFWDDLTDFRAPQRAVHCPTLCPARCLQQRTSRSLNSSALLSRLVPSRIPFSTGNLYTQPHTLLSRRPMNRVSKRVASFV